LKVPDSSCFYILKLPDSSCFPTFFGAGKSRLQQLTWPSPVFSPGFFFLQPTSGEKRERAVFWENGRRPCLKSPAKFLNCFPESLRPISSVKYPTFITVRYSWLGPTLRPPWHCIKNIHENGFTLCSLQ
jgi:hypothetical protein